MNTTKTKSTLLSSLTRPVALMALLMSSLSLMAHDFEVDGFYYNKTGAHEVAVTYNGVSQYNNDYWGKIVIPSTVTYNDTTYTVTSIGRSAFRRCGIESVSIPNTVTSIGDGGFRECKMLEKIVIPNSVTSLGWATFWADIELSKVTMSAKITELGESPFGGCDRITSFIIDKANPKYDSRENCNAIIETASNKLIQGFATTKIPNDVKIIAAAAFRSLLARGPRRSAHRSSRRPARPCHA